MPDDFDWDGNQIWIAPNCDTVAEGVLFETGHLDTSNALEAPSLMETLQLRSAPDVPEPDNSVYGFVDHLMSLEGFDSAEGIALRVMQEANALCADIPMENWPEPLNEWFESFVERIQPWVSDNLGGIGFDPEDDV